MGKQRLENARDYFDNIVEPAYQQFMDSEVNFLVVYSMAAGLYHIAEWLWLHDEAKLRLKFNIASSADLWHQVVEARVPNSGFIRDSNNAAKHAKLKFDPSKPKKSDPSTAMHHSANTFISTSGYGEGGYGSGAYGGAPQVKMDEGNREVLLEPIATAVFQFWKNLIEEFYPSPPPTMVVDPAARPVSNS